MNFKQFFIERLSQGMSLEDIAKKHNVDIKDLEAELELGTKTELEHEDPENDPEASKKARQTAMDHLVENPKYYTIVIPQVEKK